MKLGRYVTSDDSSEGLGLAEEFGKSRPTLVGNLICPFSKRVHIMLDDLGIAHERIDLDFTDKPNWLVRLNPEARIPVLVDGELSVFESRAILEYLNEQHDGGYLAKSRAERALARAWCQTVEYIHDDVRAYFLAQAEPAFSAAYERVKKRLQLVAQRCPADLLSSERLSMVGIYLGGLFVLLEVVEIGPRRFVEPGDAVQPLAQRLMAHPAVAASSSEVYRERMLHFLAARRGVLSQDPVFTQALAALPPAAKERRAQQYLNR